MKLSEREQWFLDRVGKRVWRNSLTNKRGVCENGYYIHNKDHAKSLYKFESDNLEFIKFFDTPEERDAFELTLKK